MGKICYLSRVKAKCGTRDRVESGGFDRAALAGPGAKEAESGASQPGCRRRRQPGKPKYVILIQRIGAPE
jgi:hypothetical protein